MAPKSLKCLFNIGSFLAITPCYEQKVTFLRKVYSVLLMIFITICVGVSNGYRQFYRGSMYLRVVTSILMEIVLLLFSCYTTMAVVFFKREQWQRLMKNLKIIIKALGDDRAISRAASAAIFAVIFTLVLEIFSYSVWSQIFGFGRYFWDFSVYYLEFYMLLYYNIFLCFILSLLLSYYKQLRRALLQDLFLPLKDSGATALIIMCDLILMEVEKILDLFCDLQRDYVKNPLQRRLLDDINLMILQNIPKFSGARFFDISRSTILHSLETVTTFIIISIQFRTSMINQ
ncbi:hypothetical protein BDFB_014134 [Asbolus verrucosus]|uniref:Gustatory receptor n=1 Tax=Asbolus verrucosus TaxID=1661398 RepID=A0A482V685_ASBVE|nr:hypothetical protein BDFB_014134 [Asbolus verrucosus]